MRRLRPQCLKAAVITTLEPAIHRAPVDAVDIGHDLRALAALEVLQRTLTQRFLLAARQLAAIVGATGVTSSKGD